MALDSDMDDIDFQEGGSMVRYTAGQLADLEVGTQGSSFLSFTAPFKSNHA